MTKTINLLRTGIAALFTRGALALGLSVALAGCAVGQSGSITGVPAAARESLAPTGTLRVAVYPGSPTSLVESAPPETMRGVAVDMGRLLATRLGVPVRIVVLARPAEMVAALQKGEADLKGEADFTITNASEERARIVDFTQPLIDLELGVLVPATVSRIAAVDRMDQPGATIGVSQGSSSERALGGRLVQTKLRTFPSLALAGEAMQRGEIDAFATNKGILFELAQRVPGSRVLEGRWGVEHLAFAVPKGRAVGLAWLQSFADEVRRNGELDRAVNRAGLRGTVPPGG